METVVVMIVVVTVISIVKVFMGRGAFIAMLSQLNESIEDGKLDSRITEMNDDGSTRVGIISILINEVIHEAVNTNLWFNDFKDVENIMEHEIERYEILMDDSIKIRIQKLGLNATDDYLEKLIKKEKKIINNKYFSKNNTYNRALSYAK
ncbi:MAG: hypothetical protein U9O64_10430 [Campylobacterota bacterium]|nr:hypothetical protein [Campylobacterota bacterium]